MSIEIQDETLALASRSSEDVGGRLLPQAIRRAQLLRLATRGINAKRAAEILGCSYPIVLEIYRDPMFRRSAIGRIDDAFAGVDETFKADKKSLVERLEEKAEVAFEILCDLLEAPDTSTPHRIRIAQDLMNRHSETAPIQKGQFKLDAVELMHAAKVAREMDNAANIITLPKRLTGS